MTECLAEDAILAFCRGSMAPEKRPAAEAHIAECEECRVLVSQVMRSSLVDTSDSIPAIAPATAAAASDPALRAVVDAALPKAGDVYAGKFTVERVLGTTETAIVIAARQEVRDERVALRFLRQEACAMPGVTARFLEEGKSAARIKNEHAARVVDTGTFDDGAPYLASEWVDGSDLATVSRRRGPLPTSDVLVYVLQACEAIAEAHRFGITHGRLRPSKLVLKENQDGSPHLKILGFGRMQTEGRVPSSADLAERAGTSLAIDVLRYRAPEQLASADDIDARTDVWALGLILHELVTGRPVWQADSVRRLCTLVATAPTPALREVSPTAPPALEQVILRCLAKAPADRIASVAELALALEPIAPVKARASIDRILASAGRSRDGRAPNVPSSTLPPSLTTAGASSPKSPKRGVAMIAALVGVFIVSGVALKTALSGDAQIEPSAATTSAAPPPALSLSVTSPVLASASAAPSEAPSSPSPAAKAATPRAVPHGSARRKTGAAPHPQ